MDHFHYINNIAHAEEVPLPDIVREVGTPFYCYSTATLKRHAEVFKQGFEGLNYKICYAVKANHNLAVLKTLAQEGIGADVVSEGEIRFARAAGIAAGEIVFSGVGKTAGEMAYALDTGIFQFNIESEPELRLLSEVANSKQLEAAIAIRVNPDVVAGTHAKISTGHKETKFGVPIGEAAALYHLAAQLPGIRVQGVSMHIGSQLTQLAPFREAFKHLRGFVETLRAQGHDITTVDVGGGLGIPYGKETPPHPDDYANTVRECIQDLNCTIIFEPGRLLVGNAGILVTRVIYIKQSPERTFLIVDAGMNDLLRPALYHAEHEILPVQPSGLAACTSDIVGPVCETSDIFREQYSLPACTAGDFLYIRSAGAYGASMASSYNARPLIAEVMVNGAQFHVSKPRQSYDQLLDSYRLPGWL